VPPAAKVLQDPKQVASTAAVMGAAPGTQFSPREKPTYVAQTNDPFGHSVADNLFWNDIMMEHAMFFAQLMPGPELDGPRRQAEEFQRLFARQLEMSRGIRADNYVAFNRSSIELVKRLSDYKKTMREQQLSGKLHSLVWPLFFEHTAREADRFAARLDLYNKRQIELDRAEVIDFNEVLDFKTVGEKGIYAGKIKSIIPPPLASHVRREAVRFIDELKRTQAG
jgi:Domain of unknown function (DUF2935)